MSFLIITNSSLIFSLLKKGRSNVCALWLVTKLSRRRRKVSKWLHENDSLNTRGKLSFNTLLQWINETQTNNIYAIRLIPQLIARPTIMLLPGFIFIQLTTCLFLGSASTPPHYPTTLFLHLIYDANQIPS